VLPGLHDRRGLAVWSEMFSGGVLGLVKAGALDPSRIDSFIVSEQGTAVIWGHDASGQAEQIISQVARPSVREELRQAGRDLGLGV